MSVTLTTPPPALALSGDKITAGFTCENVYDQIGARAINKITFPEFIPNGYTITIAYGGSINFTMTAAATPDDSGNQFLSRPMGSAMFPTSFLISYFVSKFELNRDFEITADGYDIIFTAKRKGLGFNMAAYNTTPGSPEVLKPSYGVIFNLYCENSDNTGFDLIYPATINIDISGVITAEAPIGDKLHDYISADIISNLPDIPELEPIICKKSCRRYYFEFAETYGDPLQIRKLYKSEIFTVLHGGMSYIGQGKTISDVLFIPGARHRFLKQGENISTTRSNQLQYLYYYNPGVTNGAILKCRLRFTDGTKAQIDLHSFEMLEKRKYGFNISFDKVYIPSDHQNKILLGYEIWLATTPGERITETQTYLIDYRPLQYIRYFLNWSSWGSLDSRMFYGKGSTEFDIVQSEATKSDNTPSDKRKGTSLVYDVKITTKLTVTTGFLKNRSNLIFMRDFYLSPLKFRDTGSELLPLKVTSKTIEEIEDGNNLYAQKFEYEYQFDDTAFTEGDIQEPGIIYMDYLTGFTNTYLTDKEQNFLATSINHDLITL